MKKQSNEMPRARAISKADLHAAYLTNDWRSRGPRRRIIAYGEINRAELKKLGAKIATVWN